VSGIFINYRGINRSYAPMLIDRELVRRFGWDNVFQAGRSNPPAADFPSNIMNRLAECTLLIALIDPAWAGADLELLRKPGDWVRKEIAWALEHGLEVLPVLLDGVKMPKTDDLPEDIAALTHKQCVRIQPRTAEGDLVRLLGEVERLVPDLVLKTLMDPDLPAPQQPAALLRAEYQVFPFQPRDELDQLVDWCLDTTGPRVHLVTGRCGEGKTRLGLRLAARMRGIGWAAGLLSASAPAAALDQLGEIGTSCLVVLDDAETRPAQMSAALRALAAAPKAPGRLLLLARSVGEWLDRLQRDTDDRVAALVDSIRPLPLAPLQPSAEHFDTACTEFAHRLGLQVPDTLANPVAPATILELQAAALTHVLSPRGSVEPPLRRILQLERGYWLRTAMSFELPEPSDKRLTEVIAAVTLFGADTEAKADALLAGLRTFQGVSVNTRDRYREFLRTVLPGPAPLNALQPDQLGEDLVADVVGNGFRLADILGAVSDPQINAALIVLGRCLPRHPHLLHSVTTLLTAEADRLIPLAMTAMPAVPQPEHLVIAMTEALDYIAPTVLDRIVAALPQRSEALDRFAVTATERALAAHQQAADGNPVSTARLALRLATRLAYLQERPDDAVDAARRAVSKLAAVTGPDSADVELRAELAEAHAALALALDLDPTASAEAREAGATAVDKYRPLAGDDQYDAALATALHNQSLRLCRAGSVESALDAATDARTLVTPLLKKKSAAYRSLYADVLDNLAVVTELSGRPTDAERLGHEALAERRTLAAARPDAYRPQLAGTLHNVGQILARHGDQVGARELLVESVAQYDNLAAQRPGRFDAERDTARAHLAEVEGTEDA
jgi:hypothetical protein